jgi:hypothetical protein
MTETQPANAPAFGRSVSVSEVDARDLSAVTDGIVDLYEGRFDVIVVRGAFDPPTMARCGERLDTCWADFAWSRPNETMPVEDVQLLGTDAPATPTFRAPRGASLDEYLASAAAHAGDAAAAFGAGFDAIGQVRAVLGRFSGARPVELPRAADGRAYAPFTIRRLAEGKQIGVHHDNHYRLDLYRELSGQVDTRTLISYVVGLRAPLSGGELFVYGATSADPDVPRLPSGFAFDLAAIESRYMRQRVAIDPGDMFLLAAGRCLHRVGRVEGPQARITMGGFLALDKAHARAYFWS